jgi:hypothetical protein
MVYCNFKKYYVLVVIVHTSLSGPCSCSKNCFAALTTCVLVRTSYDRDGGRSGNWSAKTPSDAAPRSLRSQIFTCMSSIPVLVPQ